MLHLSCIIFDADNIANIVVDVLRRSCSGNLWSGDFIKTRGAELAHHHHHFGCVPTTNVATLCLAEATTITKLSKTILTNLLLSRILCGRTDVWHSKSAFLRREEQSDEDGRDV